MPSRCCVLLVLAGALVTWPPAARAQDLTVAAAADLQAALPELVARFERETNHKVRLTFGSSGNFAAQIQNGAPFDVLLSADIDYPKRLQEAALTEPGTLMQYAVGRLVLWTRKDSGIDVGGGLQVLLAPAIRRIAIANPDHAPYGRAAVAALRRERLYDKVRTRFVLGENISQTAQFVQSGNADVGLIALSLALGPPLKASGLYAVVPASLHPPIEQGAVVLRSARDKALAKQFLAFLRRPESVQYLKTWGFEVPAP